MFIDDKNLLKIVISHSHIIYIYIYNIYIILVCQGVGRFLDPNLGAECPEPLPMTRQLALSHHHLPLPGDLPPAVIESSQFHPARIRTTGASLGSSDIQIYTNWAKNGAQTESSGAMGQSFNKFLVTIPLFL